MIIIYPILSFLQLRVKKRVFLALGLLFRGHFLLIFGTFG